MHVRSLPTLVGSAFVALGLLAVTASPAGADATTDAAATWIEEQQQPDGGIYVPAAFGSVLFETPDAILAIAEAAQTTETWSTVEALTAVEAVDGGDDAATPLDAIDDYLDSETIPSDPVAPGFDGNVEGGPAAKLIVLVAEPLGFDPAEFDPAGDGNPVDLVAALEADPPISGTLSSVAFAALADVLTVSEDLDARVEQLRAAQQLNGGWGFGGDPTGSEVDVDTTGFVMLALVAAGVPAGDASLEAGLRLLASSLSDDGIWESFGADSPNSTAVGLLALAGSGWDQADECWRTVNLPGSSSRPYVAPDTALDPPNPAAGLRALQRTEGDDAGSFITSFDVPGSIGTFATTQSVQALLRGWFPLNGTVPPLQDLSPLDAFTDVGDCAYYSQGVAWMASEGITTGYVDGTFRPAAGMTRQAIAAQLYRFAGADFAGTEQSFTDVSPAHPFYDEIEWMAETGLSTGYDDETFRPSNAVNRQQAAAFLHRIAGEPAVPEWAPSFSDVSPSHPFVGPIEWMAARRLTNPYPDGTFRPGTALNRGQLSTFLYRLASTEPAWGDVTLPASVLFGA
jgi:hypothetical protein